MSHTKIINFSLVVTNFVAIIVFFMLQLDLLTCTILVVWMNMTIYALKDIQNKAILFAFCISFFSFLLGRHMLSYYFDYEVESFNERVIVHTNICLLLSLSSLFLSYIIFYRKFKYRKVNNRSNGLPEIYVKQIEHYSLNLYWVFLVCSILYTLYLYLVVQRFGYYGSYTIEGRIATRGNIILVTLNRIDQALPVVLCIYLATFPKRTKCQKVCIWYGVYLLLTLFAGQRGPFILGILFLFIYYSYRNHRDGEVWINRKYIKIAILMFPFLLIGLGLYSKIRANERIEFNSIGDSLIGFVYQNGVSVNVIKRSYELEDLLNKDRYYSLHFIHDGIPGLIFGSDEALGNSVQKAKGYHLAHALPYLLFRDRYLEGRGSGTSYIAELYHDFGYLGVVLGNILYGILLAWICNFKKGHVFSNSVKLLIITRLLWAPRGGFTEFISLMTLPATIFVYVLIFGLTISALGIPKRTVRSH